MIEQEEGGKTNGCITLRAITSMVEVREIPASGNLDKAAVCSVVKMDVKLS